MKKTELKSKLVKNKSDEFFALLTTLGKRIENKDIAGNSRCKELIVSKSEAPARIETFKKNLLEINLPHDCFKKILDKVKYENQLSLEAKKISLGYAEGLVICIDGINDEYMEGAKRFGVSEPSPVSMEKNATVFVKKPANSKGAKSKEVAD